MKNPRLTEQDPNQTDGHLLPLQEAQKQATEKDQAVAQVAKTQQEFRNACVERERLQSQLEMLVTELSNRQVQPLTSCRILLGFFRISN